MTLCSLKKTLWKVIFIFEVRGLKSKSFRNKVRSTNGIFFVGGGGGGALKQKRAMEGTWIFSGTAHYCKCKM